DGPRGSSVKPREGPGPGFGRAGHVAPLVITALRGERAEWTAEEARGGPPSGAVLESCVCLTEVRVDPVSKALVGEPPSQQTARNRPGLRGPVDGRREFAAAGCGTGV